MKENDIVRIIDKPSNQWMNGLVGKVCFIEEIEGDMAIVCSFEPDGRTTGTGSVPLSCLAIETSKEYADGFLLYESRLNTNVLIMEGNIKRIEDLSKSIGEKYGLTGKQVIEIYDEYGSKRESALHPLNY